MASDESVTSSNGTERCILCGHEGHEDDGETDNYGDWYCETCQEVALPGETPIATDGGQPTTGMKCEIRVCTRCNKRPRVRKGVEGCPYCRYPRLVSRRVYREIYAGSDRQEADRDV